MSLAPAFDLKESHATEGRLARSPARPWQAEPCLSVPCAPWRAEWQPVLPLGADSVMRSASHSLSNSQGDGPVPRRLLVSGHLVLRRRSGQLLAQERARCACASFGDVFPPVWANHLPALARAARENSALLLGFMSTKSRS